MKVETHIIGEKELLELVRELGIPCRKHNVPACEECEKELRREPPKEKW